MAKPSLKSRKSESEATMGSLDFEPLHPDFGARVRGVSLVGDIADETVEELSLIHI